MACLQPCGGELNGYGRASGVLGAMSWVMPQEAGDKVISCYTIILRARSSDKIHASAAL